MKITVPEDGSVSGGSIVTGEGEPSAHVVIEGEVLSEPVFKGHQLLLSGTLGLKFGVQFPKDFDAAGSYVTFTVNGQEQKIETTAAETSEDGRKVYTCTLNTLQMAENIEAVFHYGNNQTVSQTYTLEQYFQYFDEHPDEFEPETLNLIKAIANYGYYAQPYLIDLHKLGDKYAKITKNYPTEFDYEAIKTAVSKYKFTKSFGTSAVTAASYKLSLDADTALSVMVKVPEGTEVEMSASFGGKTYDEVTKQNSTTYVIKIPGIKASQLGDTVTVTGKAGGDFTITISALSYVRSILEGGDKYSEDARKTVAALYQYYTAVTGK